jgi:hypothetical protein
VNTTDDGTAGRKEMAHPVTFVDLHEIDVYAQSGENERERDHECQGSLETTY